jgi:uncharacterized pyridoxal phosphate-containing UPF0001 family protein
MKTSEIVGLMGMATFTDNKDQIKKIFAFENNFRQQKLKTETAN